jgi:hypothetical protein
MVEELDRWNKQIQCCVHKAIGLGHNCYEWEAEVITDIERTSMRSGTAFLYEER